MEWEKLLCPDRVRGVVRKEGGQDLRTEFEKDYHRIVGSASFRRLQDKTQVFPLDKSDFIRTRLTHSLEVSSFGKSIGQNISRKIMSEIKDESFKPEYQIDICDILQCAGLLHDIGNPPFGHFGETVIREWFINNMDKLSYKGRPLSECLNEQMKNDFYHFEGNTQALRLVTKLHFLVDEHGMNLTKALLGTIIKYPVSSLEIDKNSGDIRTKKMGYYYAERDIFENLQESMGTNGKRHPLSFVLEAADDIAYKTADIEDAFKKGCISYGQLVSELRTYGRKYYESALEDTSEKDKVQLVYDEYNSRVDQLERKFKQALEREIHSPEEYAIKNWSVIVQGKLIFDATDSFIEHYDEIMSGTYRKELLTYEHGKLLADALGDIAYRYAFITEPIYKLEIAAETILNALLDRFVGAVINYDTDVRMTDVQEKLISLLSENYKQIYKIYSRDCDEYEKLYLRLLLVTDFICGMTDSHARQLYREFCGIE